MLNNTYRSTLTSSLQDSSRTRTAAWRKHSRRWLTPLKICDLPIPHLQLSWINWSTKSKWKKKTFSNVNILTSPHIILFLWTRSCFYWFLLLSLPCKAALKSVLMRAYPPLTMLLLDVLRCTSATTALWRV